MISPVPPFTCKQQNFTQEEKNFNQSEKLINKTRFLGKPEERMWAVIPADRRQTPFSSNLRGGGHRH
jgi:hypothetical protein